MNWNYSFKGNPLNGSGSVTASYGLYGGKLSFNGNFSNLYKSNPGWGVGVSYFHSLPGSWRQ